MQVRKNKAIGAHHGGVAHHAHVRFELGGLAGGVADFKLQSGILFRAQRRMIFPDNLRAVGQAANRVTAGIFARGNRVG